MLSGWSAGGHLTALCLGHPLISAGLGRGNKGTGYTLREIPGQGWRERWSRGGKAGFSFTIADRDETGQQALADLRSRGLAGVASALAQASDHILAVTAPGNEARTEKETRA